MATWSVYLRHKIRFSVCFHMLGEFGTLFFIILLFWFAVETGSFCVTQSGLELTIFLGMCCAGGILWVWCRVP